eukprot:291841_1
MSDYWSSSEDIELEDIEDIPNVVIDTGSHTIKAGFSSSNMPDSIFPSVVARPKSFLSHNNCMTSSKKIFIGDEATSKRGILSLKYPMEDILYQPNNIQWDDIEKIYDYTFTKLHIQRDELCERTILLTESSLNPKTNREKVVQIMFETFDVDAMYIANQSVLSLYASNGRTTGIVIDCGHNASHIVPIYEGNAIQHAILRLDIAGKHITNHFSTLLQSRGYIFKSEIVQEIKEKLAKCAVNYEYELKETETTVAQMQPNYELPDGKVITINSERFICSEILFKPSLMNKDEYKESDGIHKMIYDSINKCNKDLKEIMFNNIILNGGNTVFTGIDYRIMNELNTLVSKRIKVNIHRDMKKYKLLNGYLNQCEQYIYPAISDMIMNKYNDASNDNLGACNRKNRKYNAWIGGSILSCLSGFEEMWMSKDEYDEDGPGMVHRKCF